MLASLSARIRRLPAWGRAVAWPLYGMLWLVCQITMSLLQAAGWAAGEMFGRAKTKAKKTFAPLLWPVAAILGLVALAGVVGPQGVQLLFEQLLGPLLAIGIALFGLRIMVSGVWPTGKGKKKKK